MSGKTKHLYMTLVEVSKPVTVGDELAAALGVRVDTLRKMMTDLIRAGVVAARKRQRESATGAYKEFVLTGVPYEPPARKKSMMIHADKISEPVIQRIPSEPRWRSINAWIQGDPPIGRSALDVGPTLPTHRVLA